MDDINSNHHCRFNAWQFCQCGFFCLDRYAGPGCLAHPEGTDIRIKRQSFAATEQGDERRHPAFDGCVCPDRLF